MKMMVPAEWACSFLRNEKYKALQGHYEQSTAFRLAFISFALILQTIGLAAVCVLGIVIGSLVSGFLR